MSGWWRLVVFVCLPAVPATLLAQAGAPIVHRGALASGDQQLRSGEYYDTYEFQGRAGQRVVFDLTSTAFDPYLMVVAPSGHKEENDDYNGSNTRSRLELALEETGTYRVLVTSYKKDETGAYELRIGSGGAAPPRPRQPNANRPPAPRPPPPPDAALPAPDPLPGPARRLG